MAMQLCVMAGRARGELAREVATQLDQRAGGSVETRREVVKAFAIELLGERYLARTDWANPKMEQAVRSVVEQGVHISRLTDDDARAAAK